MATKDITVIVNGSIFKCPTDWTVEEARNEIRSRYALHGGGIEKDGIAVRATDLISALTGTLTFAGCQTGGGDLATVIKSLEKIELAVTETKDELHETTKTTQDIKNELHETTQDIKNELHETKQDIKNLKQDNQPHISKTYSEMGTNAMEALNDAKLLKQIDGKGSQLPSIMTEEDVRAMSFLSDEYESNCYVQCKLMPIFNEIGLVVVNSERPGFEWLQTLSGVGKCDKRPDLIICNPCFYEARTQPDVAVGVLAVQKKLLGEEKTLLYGIKAGHPLRFLDDISIIEGKYGMLKDPDVGQVKTYAGLQARVVTNPAFHRVVLFDREKFVLFLSKGGDFVSATKCGWSTPGSKQLMQEFFDVPSPLVKALKASCEALSVTPCTPQVNSPCILGAGGSGVVFRVTPAVADLTGTRGSTRSETAVMRSKALKVVVGDSGAVLRLHREWETAKNARGLSDRVVTVGAIFTGDGFGAYVMNEVGTAVETSSVEQKQALFTGLHGLHIRGVVHGDARVQNAISLPDGIMWIDFANAFISSEVSMLVANDFCVLFESVFAYNPSAAQVDAYKQCVGAKQILAETWGALGVL